jgi:hypothetical protein
MVGGGRGKSGHDEYTEIRAVRVMKHQKAGGVAVDAGADADVCVVVVLSGV